MENDQSDKMNQAMNMIASACVLIDDVLAPGASIEVTINRSAIISKNAQQPSKVYVYKPSSTIRINAQAKNKS